MLTREVAARAGCVAIHFVNAAGHPALVAPFGGADARFSTNPFSVAVPTGPGARGRGGGAAILAPQAPAPARPASLHAANPYGCPPPTAHGARAA
jgi:hypothetical protein